MEAKEITGSLNERTIYVPRMSNSGAEALAAALRSIGLNARPSPISDENTLELGAKYTSGEECYPEQITLGNFMKLLEVEKVNPRTIAFLMPTADGPCRFGQYKPLLRKILRDQGYKGTEIFSPTSEDSYGILGDRSDEFVRTTWRGVICTDILRKMLLKTRPYEVNRGDSDRAYKESLDDIIGVLEIEGITHRERLQKLVDVMIGVRDRFRSIPAKYTKDRPLIAVVGEIFCRLNTFSNEDLIRKVEELGGEAWLMGIAEWFYYINTEHWLKLRKHGKRFSKEMLKAKIKNWVQHRDDHRLYSLFKEDFLGYEEPSNVREVLNHSEPYLPQKGALGEMVLSTGGAIYIYNKGGDGVIDISPFTCMNGITCEAVFPIVSRDHDHIPIRNFFFDGTGQDLDRDVGIFLELASTYSHRKKKQRKYPKYF